MRKAKEKLYIAYDRDINTEYMKMHCPNAKYIGKSVLKNYRLRFRGDANKAMASAERTWGSSIPVIVWRIGTTDEGMLDIIHGYPFFSSKHSVTVKISGRNRRAMMFVMSEKNSLGNPGMVYYADILDGYIAAGFDTKPLQQAIKEALND